MTAPEYVPDPDDPSLPAEPAQPEQVAVRLPDPVEAFYEGQLVAVRVPGEPDCLQAGVYRVFYADGGDRLGVACSHGVHFLSQDDDCPDEDDRPLFRHPNQIEAEAFMAAEADHDETEDDTLFSVVDSARRQTCIGCGRDLGARHEAGCSASRGKGDRVKAADAVSIVTLASTASQVETRPLLDRFTDGQLIEAAIDLPPLIKAGDVVLTVEQGGAGWRFEGKGVTGPLNGPELWRAAPENRLYHLGDRLVANMKLSDEALSELKSMLDDSRPASAKVFTVDGQDYVTTREVRWGKDLYAILKEAGTDMDGKILITPDGQALGDHAGHELVDGAVYTSMAFREPRAPVVESDVMPEPWQRFSLSPPSSPWALGEVVAVTNGPGQPIGIGVGLGLAGHLDFRNTTAWWRPATLAESDAYRAQVLTDMAAEPRPSLTGDSVQDLADVVADVKRKAFAVGQPLRDGDAQYLRPGDRLQVLYEPEWDADALPYGLIVPYDPGHIVAGKPTVLVEGKAWHVTRFGPAPADMAETEIEDLTTPLEGTNDEPERGTFEAVIARQAVQIGAAQKALARIERWFGEFPATGRFIGEGEDRCEMSYGVAFGSNGERDYMRGVARDALEAIRTAPFPGDEPTTERPEDPHVTVYLDDKPVKMMPGAYRGRDLYEVLDVDSDARDLFVLVLGGPVAVAGGNWMISAGDRFTTAVAE